ncbi:aminoacyl-tRNA hydrolase, partial [Chloroflexota bacterium]
MKLIVGLGNPGLVHASNRHNIGFICLNHFAKMHGIRFGKKQSKARTGTGKAAESEVILARPQTYMNHSGQSVSQLVKKYNIDLDDLLVIHDDLDLPLGKIRLRQGGGSGGHKGIKSIISYLGIQDFPRLRIGIGRPTVLNEAETSETDIIDYVLSDFTPEEKQIITSIVPKVSDAILSLLTEGLTSAMNKY